MSRPTRLAVFARPAVDKHAAMLSVDPGYDRSDRAANDACNGELFSFAADAAHGSPDGNFAPNLGSEKVTTLSKTQQKNVKKGADIVARQDQAVWSAPSGRVGVTRKITLAMATTMSAFVPAIGQIAEFC